MHSHTRSHTNIFGMSWNPAKAAMAILLTLLFLTLLLLFLTLTAPPVQGQTYSVIHNFTGGGDGGDPWSGPTLDSAGKLYGTTFGGGLSNCGGGCGVVYRLAHQGSAWVLNPLYSFTGGPDGGYPVGAVTFGPNGTLFGTTTEFGSYGGGTLFNLRPRPTACPTVLCPWSEASIYQYPLNSNLPWPKGNIIFDPAGALYGTTTYGGEYGFGSVFQLSPSGGGWTETDIYDFQGLADGGYPGVGLAMDGAGNLYGTTYFGGAYGWGTVFELTGSGSSWTRTTLYSFENRSDGHGPAGGVTFDNAGNLFGGTLYGGSNGEAGIVYELSPSDGGWTFTLLYTFSGNGGTDSNVTIDSSGNIYGTTVADGSYEQGSVFKLTPSDGGWIETDLYDFTGGTDGGSPKGAVATGSNGNLYGTASQGGAYNQGVVWQIAP